MSRLRAFLCALLIFNCSAHAGILYLDTFDGDGLAVNTGSGGGAVNRSIQKHSWVDDGAATFVTNGTTYTRRALFYSENAFQSDTGFRLKVSYMTGSLQDLAAHNLSFGLVRSDSALSSYSGFNPFKIDTTVYSFGVNLTADGGREMQGLNFTDGSTVTNLDQSGTNVEFLAGQVCEVSLEFGVGGYWCLRIDDVYEASGVFVDGFDLDASYHVVVYGQDDQGGGKSIQSIQLDSAPALGERAAGLRGGWIGGQGDLDSVKDFKTLDTLGCRFTDGASQSAQHFAAHKLLETIALEGVDGTGPEIEYIVAPSWGDLSLDEPEEDTFLAEILAIRAAGFKVSAYTNSENFVGTNADSLQEFVDRWIEYCDTDPDVQEFIASQPFHTGVWNRTTESYEVAYEEDGTETYPYRKYMFCYAEYVLKDYALRYGQYIDLWTFDDGSTMEQNGDNATSGLVEEQRIYQAFANAVHAGNPDIPIAFNNGRSTLNYASYPFAHAVRFDDFTFGHAFGGNNDHASKTGSQFENNYKHITRMVETDGYVHAGGSWEWDDLIVGNFHSKLSTSAWKYGTVQAWEEEDFLQWNLEALQAGGHMTWSGSIWRSDPTLQSWAYDLLKALDDHLAQYQNPVAPSWARAYTILPDAVMGEAYSHTLEEGVDFWDPEGDAIVSLVAEGDAVSWLSISEDPDNSGQWILSGVPTGETFGSITFSLSVTDATGATGTREVELLVNASLAAKPITTSVAANSFVALTLSAVGADADNLIYTLRTSPSRGSLTGTAPDLIYTPEADFVGYDSFTYYVNDGEEDSEYVAVSIAVGIEPGLLAEWHLDDSSGSVVTDASEHGYDATLIDGSWGSGVSGGALYLDGSSGGVALPSEMLSCLCNEISLALWVYGGSTQPTNDTLLMAQNEAGDRVLNIHLPWKNSKVYWDAGSVGDLMYDRIYDSALPAEYMGRWNHWVFTKDATTGEMHVYLNGELWLSGAGKQRPMAGMVTAFLGCEDGEMFFDGMIDEVQLYNVALSSVEVVELYQTYSGYYAWLSQFIDQDDLEASSDPDADGLATVLEYVLDQDPFTADLADAVSLSLNGDNVDFSFKRRIESANDTSQIFQYSTDLVTWQDISLTGDLDSKVSLVSESEELEEVLISIPSKSFPAGQAFGRFKVLVE
jgi:hypothetical protein